MATWNLVDGLPYMPFARRRYFYPPLAGKPPGWASDEEVRTVDLARWRFSEDYHEDTSGDEHTTTDVAFHVTVTPPAGGFTDERGLPDPLIRLHALGAGDVRFEPDDDNGHRLRLDLMAFVLPLSWFGSVSWWQRWIEAGRIPQAVVYENVDRAHLRALLEALPTEDERLGDDVAQGLRFPVEVDADTKDDFIDGFLDGDATHVLHVRAGGCLGRAAAADTDDDDIPVGSRQLTLHARYSDHTDDDPQPMNPRELLYLLFGDDSAEATEHPFLLALHQSAEDAEAAALAEVDGNHRQVTARTRRMFLRPPLRTWKRLAWEAEQEVRPDLPLPDTPAELANHRSTAWARTSALTTDITFNTVRRQVDAARTFNGAGYQNAWKCNLFTYDIVVRAGFRVGIHPVGANRWHYPDSNASVNVVVRDLLMNGQPTEDRRVLMGANRGPWGNDSDKEWGFSLEGGLRHHATAPTGGLGGTVSDVASAEAVAGATVSLAGSGFSATTDANGVYGIEGVPEGVYVVTVASPAHQTLVVTDVGVADGDTAVEDFWLGAADDPAGTGTVVGTVTDGTQPIAGARVAVEGTELAVDTDEDGEFTIAGVPAGIRAITAVGDDHSPSTNTAVDVQPDSSVTTALVLEARPLSALGEYVNELMHDEGRCLVLVGGRSRRILNNDCGIRPRGIGHIVLVNEILPARHTWRDQQSPLLVDRDTAQQGEDFGFQRARVRTWEATQHGARGRVFTPQVGGASANAAGGRGFTPGRLHLIELHPGGDPDTKQGLRDLNVISRHDNLLGVGNTVPGIAAATRAHIRDVEGARDRPLGGGMCCRDSFRPGVGDDADTGVAAAPAIQEACGG
jgi:hypothetical protein